MNIDEIDLLRNLHFNSGFIIYQRMLKEKFDTEYKKLRRIKNLQELDLVNGYLSGLEYAMNIIDFELDDAKNIQEPV